MYIEFDIGPAYYNFIDARFIGEPVLRDRIFAPSQNVTYINQTVNVTNITVQNNVVYNYGPDYNTLSARSSRPIQRLNIERQTNVNLSAAAKSGGLTKVQGNKLMVGAPNKINKPAQGIAPLRVKTKVAQPKVEHGWAGVPNEAQLKQKIKTENPKNIPPPTGAAATGQAAGGVSPAGTAATTPTSPAPGRAPGVAASPAVSASPTTPAVSATPFERGKGKGQVERGVSTPTPGQPGGAANIPEQGKHRGRGPEQTGTPSATGAAPYETRGGKERGQGAYGQPSAPPAPGTGPGETRGGKQKGQGAYAQPGGAPGGGPPAGGGQEKPKGGKKKGEQVSPTPPGPQ